MVTFAVAGREADDQEAHAQNHPQLRFGEPRPALVLGASSLVVVVAQGRDCVDWFLARYPKVANERAHSLILTAAAAAAEPGPRPADDDAAHGQGLRAQRGQRSPVLCLALIMQRTQTGKGNNFEDADSALYRLKAVNDTAGHFTCRIKVSLACLAACIVFVHRCLLQRRGVASHGNVAQRPCHLVLQEAAGLIQSEGQMYCNVDVK